jgi:RNA-directed DNA polymerase
MHGHGKSDNLVVPETPSNKGNGEPLLAEKVEGSELAKGNLRWQNRSRTQGRGDLQNALLRIRQAAAKDKQQQFTTLWHHVYNIDRLREAYFNLKSGAAPGVDGQSWQEYGKNLGVNLQDLSHRLRRGAYRAKPVKRVYIPKDDGRERPIGIPVLEDKLVQRAMVAVLQAVYEQDFVGFSYGFRPGRSAHNALDALTVGILRRKVNWILDADIRGFFDTINHEWLGKFVEHRIADQRVIRHINKWLKAGVLEEGKRIQVEEGSPQGGSISPILANIYLHYVFDLWANQWRKHSSHGDVIIVRYADDITVGFQHRSDAERFKTELKQRFLKFSLKLHPDKTRLIEFGRFAGERRASRGKGKPETFDFLGFTHICGMARNGGFTVLRRPMKKRIRAKLKEIRIDLRRRMHQPIPTVGRWLRSVLNGWYRYYAVPFTYPILAVFRHRVAWLWFRSINRRSQRSRTNWKRMSPLIEQWLPTPRIMHPHPKERLTVMT